MKLIITGDFFGGGDLLDSSKKTGIEIEEFHLADKRIINLESPITNSRQSVNKPLLFAPNSSIERLKENRINACGIANNHIQDKGNEGINDTLNILKSNGIDVFGGGMNLTEASNPLFLDKNLYILGYCQYDSPTLNLVQRAERNKPGVNPLDHTKIESDLEDLPHDSKVILYFHWGREHVWLTQYKNIELAKKLLDHPKVLHIIGMHPHRIQGSLYKKGKSCYFSLGNFLFPNFYIKPKHELFYPDQEEKSNIKHYTYQYHNVYKSTYKKWKLVNRISLVLQFDTKDLSLKPIPVFQKRNEPVVIKLVGFKSNLVLLYISFLSRFYHLPKSIYIRLEQFHAWVTYKDWSLKVGISISRQLTIRELVKKITQKFR